MTATREQYSDLATILAALEERADGHWVDGQAYRYATTYDGETRIYRGAVDLEDFERDILRQSGQPTVEAAIELARTLSRQDDADWLSNVVLNQLERV